ncbi:MAG: cupin domain-containing protein [Hyphomicrobiales bacterium]|nr:cupin domain-containing protein [Hyphomicrobiales bacterium]MBV8661941.1 cupin domain-containing protein [Hyphomicrobiales bacterium]
MKDGDGLSDLASLLNVRPELDDLCRFGGGWTSPHDSAPPGWAHFHVVLHGDVVIDRPDGAPLSLQAGEVLLLPQGGRHVVRAPRAGGPAARTQSAYREGLRLRTSVDVEPDTELLCGRLHFEVAPENLIVAALPEVMVLQVGQSTLQARYRPLLQGIREELNDARPGGLGIARNLASALFTMMLRAHLETVGAAAGVFQLLSRPATMRAVAAMMKDPIRAWSLDELAEIAAMSRASLVRAFHKAGAPAPLAFLAELRLAIARRRLVDGGASLERIAAEVGYQSQTAFSRAFLRKYGVRPGKLRMEL